MASRIIGQEQTEHGLLQFGERNPITGQRFEILSREGRAPDIDFNSAGQRKFREGNRQKEIDRLQSQQRNFQRGRADFGAADQQRLNELTGGQSLTINSQQLADRPFGGQSSGNNELRERLAALESQFKPLTKQGRDEIRQRTALQFQPQIQDQLRVNDLREALFRGASAQRGNVGFGASQSFREGTLKTAENSADAINRLRQLQVSAEEQAIRAQEDADFERSRDFFGLASQLRQQEQQEVQQQIANQRALKQEQEGILQGQRQRAASALEAITSLDSSGIGNVPDEDIGQLESTLGLPKGFVRSVQSTKERAALSQSADEFRSFFNDAVKDATKLPEGQSFSLIGPDGEEFTFEGGKQNELKIISNKQGIFAVDTLTGEVKQTYGGFGGGFINNNKNTNNNNNSKNKSKNSKSSPTSSSSNLNPAGLFGVNQAPTLPNLPGPRLNQRQGLFEMGSDMNRFLFDNVAKRGTGGVDAPVDLKDFGVGDGGIINLF